MFFLCSGYAGYSHFEKIKIKSGTDNITPDMEGIKAASVVFVLIGIALFVVSVYQFIVGKPPKDNTKESTVDRIPEPRIVPPQAKPEHYTDEIRKLHKLHVDGILSGDEFIQSKKAVLKKRRSFMDKLFGNNNS
ncbi:MAG: SHOCT domain-containing protein [Bacteroidetes bacterium]|nr:SHOCT domain-containing protein [Bacteroidota bacterium]